MSIQLTLNTADCRPDAPMAGTDPSTTVQMLVVEAEALRLHAEMVAHAMPCPEASTLPMRDLSPLGR
jgi:hypothetical protein